MTASQTPTPSPRPYATLTDIAVGGGYVTGALTFDAQHSVLFYALTSGSTKSLARSKIEARAATNAQSMLSRSGSGAQFRALAVYAPSSSPGSAILYVAYITPTSSRSAMVIFSIANADTCTAPCTTAAVTTVSSSTLVGDSTIIYSMAHSEVEGFRALYYTMGATATGVRSFSLTSGQTASTLTAAGAMTVAAGPDGELWVVTYDSGLGLGLVRAKDAGLATVASMPITGAGMSSITHSCGVAAFSNDVVNICVNGGPNDVGAIIVGDLRGGSPTFTLAAQPFNGDTIALFSNNAIASVDSSISGATVAVAGVIYVPDPDAGVRRRRQLLAEGDGGSIFIGDADPDAVV